MSKLEKLVEELSKLTVLEAAELAKMLEEKWGVSAAAAVAVAASVEAVAAAAVAVFAAAVAVIAAAEAVAAGVATKSSIF